MARVVIFGDSNERYFGPPTRHWCVTSLGIAAGDIELTHRDGTFQQWCPGQKHWPGIAADLDVRTELVVIGLGGNMVSTSSAHKAAVSVLVAAIAKAAPNARLVWRGPPPATAARVKAAGGGVTVQLAGLTDKMVRYRKNRVIRGELVGLGFAVFGAARPAMAGHSRVYIDVIDLHAGGPCPPQGGAPPLALGTPACFAYEQQAIARGGALLAHERPAAGPWNTYSVSVDYMNVHVGDAPAIDLVYHHSGPGGVYG